NSPAYLRILGRSPAELQNSPPLEQVHPEDRAQIEEAAREAFRGGTGRRIEYRMRHKDGTWRVLESTASPVRNADGQVEKLVIVNRDITDRTKLCRVLRAPCQRPGVAGVEDGRQVDAAGGGLIEG